MYFSGQGRVLIAPLSAPGVLAGPFRWVGNVPNFSPAFATEKLEHKEAYTGQRLNDLTLTTANNSTFSATLEDWSPENLALAVRSNVAKTSAGAPVAAEPHLDGVGAVLEVGGVITLRHPKVSSVVVKDSTAVTPKTLVVNTDYTVDAAFGTVTFIGNPASFDLPLVVDYTHAGALTVVPFFTAGIKEVAVRFEGVNTADNNKRVLAELYRVALDPTAELGLITEELGTFTLEGNCLIDNTKNDDVLFGKFGRVLYLD